MLLYRSIQLLIQSILESIVFRVLTVLLIILDFTLVVIDLTNYECDSNSGLEIVSHIIISYFLLEVGARIFYLR